jgi:hypothetical protein
MARCGLNVRNWNLTGVGISGSKAQAISSATSMAIAIGKALAAEFGAAQDCPTNRPCRVRIPAAPDVERGAVDRPGGGQWQIAPGVWMAVRRVRFGAWFWCLETADDPRVYPKGYRLIEDDEKTRSVRRKPRIARRTARGPRRR